MGTTILAGRLYKAVALHDEQVKLYSLEKLWNAHKDSVEVVKHELWGDEEMSLMKDLLQDTNITGDEIKYWIGKGWMEMEIDEWE